MFGVPAAERPSVFGVPAAERPPAPAPAPDRRRAAQLMATPWGMVKCVGGGQAAGADPFRTWTLYRSTRSTPIEVVDVAGGSRQDWAVVRAVLQAILDSGLVDDFVNHVLVPSELALFRKVRELARGACACVKGSTKP